VRFQEITGFSAEVATEKFVEGGTNFGHLQHIGKIDGLEKVVISIFAPISVGVFYCQISISAMRVKL